MAAFWIQDNEIIINARKEAGLINPETNNFLELDIYIPSLKLALEYQVSLSHIPNLHLPSLLISHNCVIRRYIIMQAVNTHTILWKGTKRETKSNSTWPRKRASLLFWSPFGGMAKKKGTPPRCWIELLITICSLLGTIMAERPDLFPTSNGDTPSLSSSGLPSIPKDMPSTALRKHVFHVEDIGQPTTACFLTKSGTDPSNW